MIEDGEVIGRIYEQHAARRPEQAWFWSITALIPNPYRRPDQWTRRDLRGREGAVFGSLVAGLEASAGMRRRCGRPWDKKRKAQFALVEPGSLGAMIEGLGSSYRPSMVNKELTGPRVLDHPKLSERANELEGRRPSPKPSPRLDASRPNPILRGYLVASSNPE